MAKKRKKQKANWLFRLLLGLMILGIGWAAEVLTDVRIPQSDQPPLLYSNQMRDDLTRTFSTAMRHAKQSIVLMIYSLTDPTMIQTLREKAEQGIDVLVICDGEASQYAHKKLGSKVRTLRKFLNGLMHLKLLVIDSHQVWVGSANMTSHSLKIHGNLVLASECAPLAEMVLAKASCLEHELEGILAPHRKFLMKDQLVEFSFLPDDPRAVHRMIRLMRSAKKTLRVAMFTWTREDFAEEIIDAHHRGVQVEAVIDYNSGKGASAKIYEKLKKEGIPVHLSQSEGLLHYKMMYIDRSILVNGSANWTKAAFTKNQDCFMILHDLKPEQSLWLDRLWERIRDETQSEIEEAA